MIIEGRVLPLRELFKRYPHARILCEAEWYGGCELVCADQVGSSFNGTTRRPKIFLIGDDTSLSMGPGAFHQQSLIAAIRSSAVFCVISCAAVPSVYACMAYSASRYRKDVMIVETRQEHEAAWYNFIEQHEPTKGILLATAEAGGHA